MLKPQQKREPSYIDSLDTSVCIGRPLIDIKKLRRRIYLLRVQQNMTQAQLSVKTNGALSRSYVQRIEGGQAQLSSIITLDNIAKALGIKLSELISSIEDPS